MKKQWLLLALILAAGPFLDCTEPTKSEAVTVGEMVAMSGRVINTTTAAPIVNAVVLILNHTPEQSTVTDAQGLFFFEFEIEQTIELNIIAYRENFFADTISTLAVPGRTIEDLQLDLSASDSGAVASGNAASIILYRTSPTSIGVRESGAPEVAEITFEVQDSSGIPVDLDHSVDVRFELGAMPGGGALLHPSVNETDFRGHTVTNVFSGDSAGVVQIVAVVDQEGKTLRSKPVTIAIHGGLPDQLHFSLASEKLNFPGYNLFGLTNGITAYVGDKYGNPVKQLTPVYFTTTGGIVEGAARTDAIGQAGVSLLSAAPRPTHPVLGPGFATITGRTADENQNTIEALTIVLFSGLPQISVSPSSISVPNQGSQNFSFSVSDQNGNPLAANTKISVVVESGSVEVAGNNNLTLPDTQSPFWTSFGFTLIDSKPDTLLSGPVNIKISTSGPNGGLERLMSGYSE